VRRLVRSKRHLRNSRREELPRACAAGVVGVFGAYEQMEALGAVEATKNSNLVGANGIG